MKKTFFLLLTLFCALRAAASVPVYVWQGWDDRTTAETLRRDFAEWRRNGVTGVCFGAKFDLDRIRLASRLAHEAGLEYHAWVPAMVHADCPSDWYVVNRLGQSAATQPAYVDYYRFLDPNNEAVQAFLIEKCRAVAALPDVDYVQLDYIRYPDVVLARGLWAKYGLTMHEEYAPADYCYCDRCVADFLRLSGRDIRRVADPSRDKEWAQFRCDNITRLVNRVAAAVHALGKRVSADVFPGPHSHARRMVRQEWHCWDVDMLFPMNYNDFYLQPASWVRKMVREEVKAVGKHVPVVSGLFICRDWRNKATVADPEHSGLLPSEMRTAVRGSLRAGAVGISLFTPQSMTAEHWAALRQALDTAP